MSHAIIRDDAPSIVSPRHPITDASGVQHPGNILNLWSAADLAAIGVHPIVEIPIPGLHRSTGSALTWDGETVRRVHSVEELPPIDLAALKAALKAAVDAAAETERARYITPGSGQALTYSHKAQESARYLLDPDPQDSDYPLLAAEVGVTGETLHQVAQIVMHMHAQWQVVGGAIERARLAAKAAVDAAEDEAAARAVVPTWP